MPFQIYGETYFGTKDIAKHCALTSTTAGRIMRDLGSEAPGTNHCGRSWYRINEDEYNTLCALIMEGKKLLPCHPRRPLRQLSGSLGNRLAQIREINTQRSIKKNPTTSKHDPVYTVADLRDKTGLRSDVIRYHLAKRLPDHQQGKHYRLSRAIFEQTISELLTKRGSAVQRAMRASQSE